MKVFISYVSNNTNFDNIITEIDHLPNNEEELVQLTVKIRDRIYQGCRSDRPYVTILNIVIISQ